MSNESELEKDKRINNNGISDGAPQLNGTISSVLNSQNGTHGLNGSVLNSQNGTKDINGSSKLTDYDIPKTNKVHANNGYLAPPTDEVKNRKQRSNKSRLTNCNDILLRPLERFFCAHGRRVAAHPFITIITCLVVTGAMSTGNYFFDVELRPFKLWIPQSSEFIRLLNWQSENFPNTFRQHVIIWESQNEDNPNILTAEAIQEMWRIHQDVENTVIPGRNVSWNKVCNKLPSFDIGDEEEGEEVEGEDWELGTLQFRRRKKREIEVTNDISLALSRNSYCGIIQSLPSYCDEKGLLEVWGYHNEIIMNLTDEKVLEDLNNAVLSEVFGYRVDFAKYLGGIETDVNGSIVSAKAAQQTWISKINEEAIEKNDYKVDTGSGLLVDADGMSWEHLWTDIVLDTSRRPTSIKAFAKSESSFGRVSDDNIYGDVTFLMIGLILMGTFVNFTLGRRNLVEQRPLLTVCGMLSVTLAIFSSYGLCSFFGIKYNPVNSILPLLVLGLGVDDMFIIIAIWDSKKEKFDNKGNITTKISHEDLVKRAGETMRHAGVAITATSITDVTAFAIGASTDLPALRSFCIYASLGILAVFILQTTLFLAFLVLDEKRMNKKRDGFFWCITHENWKPFSCSQVDVLNRGFSWYGKIIIKKPIQIIVLGVTIAILVLSTIGTIKLHKEFNPHWFIPDDSYLSQYFRKQEEFFAQDGAFSFIFFSNTSLSENLETLQNLTTAIGNENSVLHTSKWPTLLEKYINANDGFSNKNIDENIILEVLPLFLNSPTGAEYMNEIMFSGAISCYSEAASIDHFRVLFKYKHLQYSNQQMEARNNISKITSKYFIPGYEGIWSEAYGVWETNEIVGQELIRNLSLAGLVIGAMTLVLLISIKAAILVVLCVASTLVGVGGCMYLAGLTIDTVSCISLVLCIGLSVDYSVHIAHSFLAERSTENRKDRISLSLAKVGPAVFQGGVSTLIPFVMLAFSNSHVFKTFFVVFTPTTVLGLYYALVVLPIFLSLIGPEAYEDTLSSTVISGGHENICHSIDSEEMKETNSQITEPI